MVNFALLTKTYLFLPLCPFLESVSNTGFLLPAVVQQFYQSRVIDEFVLRGNTGILKCLVPSFVTDFVQVEAWISDDGKTHSYEPNNTNKDGNNSCTTGYISILLIHPCSVISSNSSFYSKDIIGTYLFLMC